MKTAKCNLGLIVTLLIPVFLVALGLCLMKFTNAPEALIITPLTIGGAGIIAGIFLVLQWMSEFSK